MYRVISECPKVSSEVANRSRSHGSLATGRPIWFQVSRVSIVGGGACFSSLTLAYSPAAERRVGTHTTTYKTTHTNTILLEHPSSSSESFWRLFQWLFSSWSWRFLEVMLLMLLQYIKFGTSSALGLLFLGIFVSIIVLWFSTIVWEYVQCFRFSAVFWHEWLISNMHSFLNVESFVVKPSMQCIGTYAS